MSIWSNACCCALLGRSHLQTMAGPCSASTAGTPLLHALQLNRILLTHAPYLTKLESLASSATRRVLQLAQLVVVWHCAAAHLCSIRARPSFQLELFTSRATAPHRCLLPLAPHRTAEKINAGLIIVMVQTGCAGWHLNWAGGAR